jgi:glucose-1-phosphate cytidylyltransferase
MGDATATRPKPLVEIGDHPILWHILKGYAAQGITDFVVCAGYAGHMLAEYFDRTPVEGWRVEVVDTGVATPTGGRLLRSRTVIGDTTFCLTYGDGVADVDLDALLAFHRAQKRLVTVTAVQPRLPFGVISFANNGAGVEFVEKPRLPDVWINGGFFVVEPKALDYIEREDEAWEEGPLTRLSAAGQLAGFKHDGFWQCMDAPRDRELLEDLWREGRAPWKRW